EKEWQAPTSSIVFSPQSTKLAVNTHDELWIWNLESPDVPPAVIGPVKSARRPIDSLLATFFPDGTRVAAAPEYYATVFDVISVFDPGKPNLSFPLFEGSLRGVQTLAFSDDSAYLAASTLQRTVLVWDARKPSAPALILTAP